MALIAGFPDFTAKAALLADDLNSALDKIVAQIGGVDSGNVQRAGNLDLTNHAAAVGWRNAQKLEPRALVPFGMQASGQPDGPHVGEIPYAVALVGATIVVPHATNRVLELEVELRVDGALVATLIAPAPAQSIAQVFSWNLGGTLPAGARVQSKMKKLVMSNANNYYDGIHLTLWCAAAHVE